MKKINFGCCAAAVFLILTVYAENGFSQKGERSQFFSPPAISTSAAESTREERLGSADKLTGKIYNLTVFISTPNNPWKKQDKLKMLEKQKTAQNWLIERAAEYDVELEFENGTFGASGNDVSVAKIPVSDDTGKGMYVNWGSDLLQKVGYKNPLSLWKWVEENTDCANLQVIVYSNSTGVSYTLPFRPELNADKYFVEVSFLHRYHPTGPEVYPSTIAHENLHLYGAWDLYNSYRQNNDVASKAKEYFPNDIMYRTLYDLDRMEINELTAWRIGWNEIEKPWYKWFKPGE